MRDLIGQSKPIQQVRKKIKALAKSRKNVLVVGEGGVGKAIVAENLHRASEDATKPFILLDVAGIEEFKLRSLVQSVLTHRQFVNPMTSGHGNFDLPDGATIAIERVELASLTSQRIVQALLSGIHEKGFHVRLILLLGADPRTSVRDGKLSGDIYKATRGWEIIYVPSLRERQEDIPEIIEHFVHQTAKELGLGEVTIDINAVSILVRREWKGNVQEVKTFVEQAMMLSDDKDTFLLPESLLDEHSELTRMLDRIDRGIDFALDRSMELIEKRILERVLKKFGFNQSRAAKFLNITEDTLRYRVKKLGIATNYYPEGV